MNWVWLFADFAVALLGSYLGILLGMRRRPPMRPWRHLGTHVSPTWIVETKDPPTG